MKLSAPVRITKGSTRVRLTLWPPQDGSHVPLMDYGSDLVCVRYRYDTKRKRKYKTVELIVDEGPWRPKKGNKQ